MNIKEIQEEIIQDFSYLDDWEQKYEYIISLGKSLPPLEERFRQEDYLIKGCQSRVWLKAGMEEGKIRFIADSDAIITKGVIALLIKVLDDHSPKDVSSADLFFIDAIGLSEHLSPTRSNGLRSMVTHMKSFAKHLDQENDKE
jgi:cysteine desulfuration protein SufE